MSDGKQTRHMFQRNPYYHRIDAKGVQLPYIDTVEMEIVSGRYRRWGMSRKGSLP